MIRWHIQSVADHPSLAAGRPPVGLLTPDEMAHYDGYYSPRRRRDWLLGRWTAKRLIQATVAREEGWTPPLDSFSIGQAPSGAPFVQSELPALSEHRHVPLGVSISHSSGYALSAVTVGVPGANDNGNDMWDATLRLGADIEFVEQRGPSYTNDFFTPEEQAHLSTLPVDYQTLMTTATWSAKEAVMKATQVGMRADPHFVQCFLRPARPRHWTSFLIELSPSKIDPCVDLSTQGTQAFNGWWRVMENCLHPGSHFVLTLAAQGETI